MYKINDYINNSIDILTNLQIDTIPIIVELINDTIKYNKNIYIIGNGGSAALASHMSEDIQKALKVDLNRNSHVTSLVENIPLLTAIANDIGYEYIFSFQLKTILKENDLVIAISGSGNSTNILNAIETAKEMNAKTIALTSIQGKLRGIVDYSIDVPTEDMQYIEDIHTIIMHIIYKSLLEYKDI